MALHVYGRQARRRFERQTGERIVWAAGVWLTDIGHGHWRWHQPRAVWLPLPWASDTDCGLHLASCRTLFGVDRDGAPRHFMLGGCDRCAAGVREPHRWDCPNLLTAMDSVDPDYWPRPVHRPLWMDDKRKVNR
jgi:hypothetical protein